MRDETALVHKKRWYLNQYCKASNFHVLFFPFFFGTFCPFFRLTFKCSHHGGIKCQSSVSLVDHEIIKNDAQSCTLKTTTFRIADKLKQVAGVASEIAGLRNHTLHNLVSLEAKRLP